MTLYGARKIAKAIRDYTKEKSKEPTGNQNCLLCTWCAEAQFRGINILPRPVYSPRDSIFTHTGRGLDIVYNPKKQSVSNITDLKDRCLSSHQDSRYYCHVNWNGSTGGHEFLLLIIDEKIYVMDAQQGIVTDIGSEKGMYYFNDINWSNTFIARIDDKNLNVSLLMKENDPKNTLPWNPDKDIPYMKEQGMIPDADHVMRDATDDDLEFVYFSELETVEENKNDPKVQKYIRQDAKESIGHTKIIVVNGEDVGVYQAYATNEWGLREGKKDWWYLAHIYIKPAYRGLGIGSNIIKQDIRNHDKILLQVMKSNKRAMKLYESLGFKFSQENDHGGIVMRYEKNKQPIQETYIDYNDSLIPVEKYKFNTVYFGTQNRLTKTININQQLFVTPYKGIASIFSADNGVKKKLFELGIFSSNMSYDEWDKTSGLDKLFKIVHVKVKVFIGRPFEKFEVDGKGYVYEIDITNLKNNIFIYDWMTKSREVLIANIDQVPIKSTYETNIKYIVEMENDLDNISSNEIFRVEYDENHVGIYEALKQAMIKAGKSDEWKRFLQLDAVKKLPEPPEYKDGYQSWFSSKGKREVWDKVKDIFYKYLDEKKFVYMVKSLKDLAGGKIVYSDKYQYVIDTNDDSIQEQFIEEAYRDSHFNKLYFHLSPESYLDGQVFKPRVPEYLDRYDPEDKNFENDTTPRVCFSPSIEGCLNGIMVNMPRVNVMPAKATRFYVYTTEKPFHEYKHKTNKELIRDKDIFDASVTDEVWILEPVRMKLYGVIEIDSVYNVKRKQNVPTVSGKKSTRPYYKYKWHWLVKPKVLEKSTRYDYSVPKVIDNLCYELPKFKYGLIRNGKLQSGNVSESDYNKYWVVHSPTEIDQAGGGNCYDMVEWETDYLESYGVNYNKYYVALVKGERNDTHTFIVVKDNGRYIYIEQAFKRVVDEIGNSKEFDKLEDIFKYVIECMCEFGNYSNWNYETIWDYTDIKFKVGTPMKNFTEYITTNGNIVYEGDVNNKSKTKKE